ncbi:MAG: hypothetical protein Q8K63_09560 [Acidimicrobiales bacterium]|nr:hypothetical protein [Acidimicrobiales bacterium]
MSKYDPLRLHLEAAPDETLAMTFDEIATLVDGLPPSAFNHREWWSNNPRTTAPRHAWLPAGRRVEHVDMTQRKVRFSAPGAPTAKSQAKPRVAEPSDSHEPVPVALAPDEIAGLEAFLTFRGDSRQLRYRIASVESAVQGRRALEALEAAKAWGVNKSLLAGARVAKRAAAQVDVVLHAAGILHALPHVLDDDEVVEYVSLGAGNTGRAHDLETDRQVAEFKFINWAGGAETVRQDTLLIDLFNLATASTTKRRVMYVTGIDVPLHWLETSKRLTRECLARKRRIPGRFDAHYGPDGHPYVRDFWAHIKDLVALTDLAPLVPGLVGIDEPPAEDSEVVSP